jgi:hypothetical protein
VPTGSTDPRRDDEEESPRPTLNLSQIKYDILYKFDDDVE